MDAGLVGRHPDDAEERLESDFVSRIGTSDPRVRVELPEKSESVASAQTEPIVERRAPASCLRDAASADPHLVDPDRERLPCPCAADREGPDQRMAGVELAVASFRKELVLGRAPAGIQARERDRVARIDGEHRLEVTREMTVERAPLERDLVVRH